MINSSPIVRPRLTTLAKFTRALLPLLLLLAAASARADWPGTNVTKWVQFPDRNLTGYDILVGQLTGSQPLMVADDFPCRVTGPITDIHIWASWLGDSPDPDIPITLSFWSDVPAITNATGITPSHPGDMLWSQTFGPGQYAIKTWSSAEEHFWNPDPAPAGDIMGMDHMVWQYNFYPANPFVQQGSTANPRVYWLGVTAGTNFGLVGWKTATNHWNDDAVFGHLDPAGLPLKDWKELRDPLSTVNRSLDMAFALTTVDIPDPPPVTDKWAQYPDMSGGLDVKATRPNIVADDFLCKAAGRITNIQVWASWRQDLTPDPNTRFVLGIWTDVPAGSAVPYSHPRTLLWTETFAPGSYGLVQDGIGDELFYEPDEGLLTPETRVWRYIFNPKQPFCQKGSTNNPVTYWLSLWADTSTPSALVGWKTSTNHWSDDAVYGHLDPTGTAIGDWKELHDPTTGNSLDLAFILHDSPATADCDPLPNPPKPKWMQRPDTSTNGLDVLANFPKVLGDDFPCRRPGLINGIRVWGSWLEDKVDPNTTFTLGLWTDIPAVPGDPKSYSQPGELLCTTTFYPSTTVGTILPRYNYGLAVSNVQERFFDPDVTPGILGNDTQIWRYDFYPRRPCWRQYGTATAPKTYWVSLTANPSNPDQFRFGWKTSATHWSDDGVWGHLDAAGNALKDWKDLRDPGTQESLDLSFALRSFPIVGINKDLKNTMTVAANGVRIVVAGIHEITVHYDDVPPWPSFQVDYAGGNTVLQWSGKNVAAGAITHIGFEMGGTSLTIVSMAWLQGNAVIGVPIQVNHHLWNNGGVLVLNHNIVPGGVIPQDGQVEFFADPVALELMNPGAQRTPLAVMPLQVPPSPVLPGGALRVPLPAGPPEARYALILLSLADERGMMATMDFVQLPLDSALRPNIHGFSPAGSFFDVFWDTIPGRTYRLQTTRSLGAPSWMDVFEGDSADGDDMGAMIPMSANMGFMRVILVPE